MVRWTTWCLTALVCTPRCLQLMFETAFQNGNFFAIYYRISSFAHDNHMQASTTLFNQPPSP
jgi:hypothetical protein